MRMIEIDYEAQPPVDSYGPGGFRIAGQWHVGSLLVLPEGISTIEAIDADALTAALRDPPEIDLLLIGQGPEIAPVPRALRALFDNAGIGIEPMSTPSACRTYNVLLTEDRRVGAALLAV